MYMQSVRPALCYGNVKRTFRLQGCFKSRDSVASAAAQRQEGSALDVNRLQTRLSKAVTSEDFAEAARIRDELEALHGGKSVSHTGWAGLGVPSWLADRAERLGFLMPTDMQHQATSAFILGADMLLRAQTGSGKTLAFLMPLLSMLEYPPQLYPDDLKGPQAVIVVPHRELGVQICMLVYRLLGGSVNKGIPGEQATMFSYFGPRGIQVRGVLDKEEVLWTKTSGYIDRCHVVVGTPDCLAEVLEDPQAQEVMQHTKVVVVDEADECVMNHREAMRRVLGAACSQEDKPSLAFVGASMDAQLTNILQEERWLTFPVTINGPGEALLPPSIKHSFVVVPDGVTRGLVLSKLLRGILKARGEDAPSPRVLAFAADAVAAEALATPLRSALWEEYRIGLVLPQGEQPTKILEDFRDCKTSMLLLTPDLARGLDLPAVSHAFNIELPGTSVEYMHRAGRVGRIGNDVGGVMTTLVMQEEVPEMEAMAAALGIEARQQSVDVLLDPQAEGKEMRKALEDLFNLY